jgi:hypothetical protein
MKGSAFECVSPPRRVLNAVALENAVLCAQCEVISDSPHDKCQVCGSQSVFNIARLFGGKLPKQRASLVARKPVDAPSSEVLSFPTQHRVRRRASASSRQLLAFSEDKADEANRGMLLAETEGPRHVPSTALK